MCASSEPHVISRKILFSLIYSARNSKLYVAFDGLIDSSVFYEFELFYNLSEGFYLGSNDSVLFDLDKFRQNRPSRIFLLIISDSKSIVF